MTPLSRVWLACGVSAVVLGATVQGTVAGWTKAEITNSKNDAITGSAVVLKETSGAMTCRSDDSVTNDSTCTTINKYGGAQKTSDGTAVTAGTVWQPGDSRYTDITFTNVGNASAKQFTFEPAACSQTPAVGTGTPAAINLCTSGDLKVAVSCSDGATYVVGSAWSDLAQTAVAPGSLTTKTRTATLAASASWTCRLTVSLGATAPQGAQGVQVSQSIKWTLVKA